MSDRSRYALIPRYGGFLDYHYASSILCEFCGASRQEIISEHEQRELRVNEATWSVAARPGSAIRTDSVIDATLGDPRDLTVDHYACPGRYWCTCGKS